MIQRTLPEKWDEEVDVVIIGSGFSGLAASIEAKIAGCSVLILEKMKGYGGNSVISDGVVGAAGTTFQKKAGIKDSPQLMYEDMLKAGLSLNHPELARIVAESSADIFQWTIDYLGVKYKDRVDQFGGHSVPRSYTTYNNSGSAIVKKLLVKIKELGIDVRLRTYLKKIFKNSDDRVCGVRVREGYSYPDPKSGIPKNIMANKAIILATGGFANDINFRTIQDPRLTNVIDSTNRPSTTAEALKEAMGIGAAPVHLDWIQLGSWTSPDEKMLGVGPDFAGYIVFPYGILIDPTTGKRLVNELADRKTRADAILNVGQPCIGISDEKGVMLSGRQINHCLKKGVVKKFELLEELADYYKILLSTFKDTIDQYNNYVENGSDKEFNKPILPGTKPLKHPPFYGIRLWPKVHHTMGGVLINRRAQVINLDHKPIEGMFAAGEVTGGIHGACRLGSCAIPDCLVFGRIAGKNASSNKV